MLFSEVYSAYFSAVTVIIAEILTGHMSEKRLLGIIGDTAFSESILSIMPSIKNEEWLVINRELCTPIKHPPQMPLTILQKRWLKGLFSDPRIALFAPDITGLEDVEPLFSHDDFVFFDRYADGDPYTDEAYIMHFRTILTAIKEKRRIHIQYHNRTGQRTHGRYIPYKLEYSSKDDKFRLLTAGRKFAVYINLARIIKCELLEPYTESDIHLPLHRENTVSFTLTDQRNALDRVMLHFSDCRKETRRSDTSTYQVTLWYEPQDETEMLIRILSFGPMIEVTEPESFITLIKDRLNMQKKILE